VKSVVFFVLSLVVATLASAAIESGGSLKVTSPEPRTYRTVTIPLNFTFEGDQAGCSYVLNDMQHDLPGCKETMLTARQGQNSLIIYVNDSSGNVVGTFLSFTVTSTSSPQMPSPLKPSRIEPSKEPAKAMYGLTLSIFIGGAIILGAIVILLVWLGAPKLVKAPVHATGGTEISEHAKTDARAYIASMSALGHSHVMIWEALVRRGWPGDLADALLAENGPHRVTAHGDRMRGEILLR
jgi:hypothetical protein